jgi:hypothetical protein
VEIALQKGDCFASLAMTERSASITLGAISLPMKVFIDGFEIINCLIIVFFRGRHSRESA